VGKQLGRVVFKELREIGIFRVVPGRVTWNTVKRLRKRRVFVPDCPDQPRCIRAVGRGLRAKVVYTLYVAKADEGVTLSMRTFDVKSGKEVRQGSEHASEDPEDLARAARWVTRRVSSPMISTLAKGKGRLQVNSSEEGADLYLNGKSFGKRTGKSFKVGSGVFDIEVKKDGFEPFHEVVVIKPGVEKVIEATLEASEEPAPALVATTPDEKTPDEGAKDPGEKDKPADLPAWAVFEKKPKAKPLVLGKKEPGGEGKPKETAALMPWQKAGKKKDFMPDTKKKDEPATGRRRSEKEFYETWWFWTIVGAGAVAAGGTVTYFLLTGDEGSSGVGNARVVWP
jgi:hypothetical protein